MKKVIIALMTVVLAVSCMSVLFACNKADYTIGVQGGTTGEFYVKGNQDMLLEGFSNIDCKSFNNGGLAVKAMLDGQVDYVIIDNEPAKELVKKTEGIKIIDIALTTEEYAYGVDKNQAELLTAVNSLIAEIKANGKLDELFAKYAALEYDDEGNVIGGDDAIEGITSGTKDASKAAQQLVVSTNAAFAPYEYKKGDKFAGIDMEIAKMIADKLNLELVIDDMDFDAVVTSVGKNNVDIAMAGLSVTATRKQSVNFSDAYYQGAYQVLVVKTSETKFDNCKTKEDVEALLKTK